MRRIRAEKLQPGSLLPSEAVMLKEYGVGRASLREALRVLEVNGLITVKPGPGRWAGRGERPRAASSAAWLSSTSRPPA